MKDDDKGALDLTFLIDNHKREIWEYKQRESQWIKDKNQLDGHKRIVEELSEKIINLTKERMAINDRLAEQYNINDGHKELNGKLQKQLSEVREDNKKLAKQIEDLNKRLSLLKVL
jgi:predicted nuclease with TOPRIM domain